MVGVLATQGIHVGTQRVGQSLARVNPGYHQRRQNRTERQINPIPYNATHFGHKLHVDQNEKLVLFGVTHVCAIDGYSSMIVGFATFPVKNNVLIYDQLYRLVFIMKFLTVFVLLASQKTYTTLWTLGPDTYRSRKGVELDAICE